MRVACRDLDSFVPVHLAFFQDDLSRGKFRLKRAVAELTVGVPTPRVNLAEGRPGNRVAISALNRIDAFASLFEALDELGDVVRIDVAQTKLSVLVVLAHRVDVSLDADEEAEVVATGNPLDLDFVAEGHPNGVANLLALHGKWPGETFTSLACRQGQVATGSIAAYCQVLLREEGQAGGLVNVTVVAETELASLVAAPHKQVIRASVLQLNDAPVLNS